MVLSAPKARMPLAALAVVLAGVLGALLVALRPQPPVVRETAPVPVAQHQREPVVLAEAEQETVQPDGAPTPPTPPAPAQEAAAEAPSRSEPEGSPPTRSESERKRLASVRGRLDPPLQGALVLVGGHGVLPLDCEAIAWPVEPDDPPPGPVHRTRTRSDGSFAFSGLEPGPLRLAVSVPGEPRLEREDLWVLAGDDLDLGVLAFGPARAFTVRVTDASGAVVEGTRLYLVPQRFSGPVRALGAAACSPIGESERDGVFEGVALPPGRSLLLAVAPGHPPAWSDVVIGRSDSPRTLQIELPVALEVRGELIDVDGLGLAGLRVGAFSLRAPRVTFDQARAAGVPPQALAAWRTTTADVQRRFVLDGLEYGETVLLRALGEDRLDVPDAFAPDVLATAGDPAIELFRRAGAELAFEVVDDRTGKGLEPVLVTLEPFFAESVEPAHQRWFRASRVVWADVRPRRAAPDPLYADLPESEDLVISLRAGGGTQLAGYFQRLRSGERLDLGQVRVPLLAPLHVLVREAVSGLALADATCELIPVVADPQPSNVARGGTDARGRASLVPRLEAAHDLLVRHEGHAPLRVRAPASSLADSPFEVVLVPGGTLRVRVLDAERRPVRAEVLRRKAGAEVASSLIEEHERALTDAEGVVEFTSLEPGMASVAARALARHDLDLEVDPARLTWVAASVASGAVTEIEAPAAALLGLTVTPIADGRPLPNALVRLSADPTAFSDPYADAAQLAAWPTARCDASGRARFEGLPPADYVLRVEHPDLTGFGRAVVRLEPRSQAAWTEVRGGGIAGWVVDENEGVFAEASVFAWALAPVWEEERELEPWTSLAEIAPEPVLLGLASRGDDGVFALTGPRGVQTVLTGVDQESGYAGDFWLAELPEVRESEPIALYTAPSARLSAYLVRPTGGGPRSAGIVAVCLDQPWGRGIVAQPLQGDGLELDHVPQGRWRACAVELASGHLIVEIGPWVEVAFLPQDEPLYLPWRE